MKEQLSAAANKRMIKEYFRVNAEKYVPNKSFWVCRPASLDFPKDNAVMFVTAPYAEKAGALLECRECLVFMHESISVSAEIYERHAVRSCEDPRNAYCLFFRENGIVHYPCAEDFDAVNGALIAKSARIGENCTILPGAYIGGDVEIGNGCYIGSGARLVGEVRVGDNVVIRENAVIGADGLSTDRDGEGKALTMPQFGGVILEDDVHIGALTVIGRGAIDFTIIKRGSKIDNSAFISHNVTVGEDTFIVGETIMFGSSSTGKQVFISGNATIRDGRHVGDNATVGMGAVVLKDVGAGQTAKGFTVSGDDRR